MPILHAKGVTKRFGGVVALKQAGLTCKKGQITGLLGTNGSGKSTLSKIITGVYGKDEGTIIFDGKEINHNNPCEAKAGGISMVFQNLSLIPDLTVWQNIVLGIEEVKGWFLDDKAAIQLSEKILVELMPGLDVHRKVSSLNTGEMQIVEIAKAISIQPKLLILDEPTAALEQAEVNSLFRYMRLLAKEGTAMIFTSHRMWEVMEICDNITVFRNGENVGSVDFEQEGKDTEQIIKMIVGDVGDVNVSKKYRDIPANYALEVEQLQYGKFLKDIGFKLKKGEVLGIGGLAGQGQSELMLALAGNYREAKGNIQVSGKPVPLTKPQTALRNGILLVPGDRQQQGTFQQKSIYYNMIYPKLGLAKQPFFTPRKKYRKEVEDTCEALSVRAANIDADLYTLSGGNQQKIVVGKWLSFDCKILLLADPAKGVDIRAKKDLYDFVIKLVREKEMSVILYASDSDELIAYCDRLLIMYEGSVVSELQAEEITEDNIVAKSMKI